MPFRITTWNVNGIRNPFGYQPWREDRTFQAMFKILEADIVVMQECKIQRKDLTDDMVLVPGWDVHFSLPKHKKGYSGVAIYTNTSTCCPIRAEEGITGILCPPNNPTTSYRDLPPDQQIGGYPRPDQLTSTIDAPTLDSEGRCVILEFPAFVVIGVYCPATRDESRHEFRLAFLEALDARVRNLVYQCEKEVILLGDLNIIRNELDLANCLTQLRQEDVKLADFLSSPTRRLFNQLLHEGRVIGERDEGRKEPVLWDLARLHHPGREGMFTCWDTRMNARPANFGSRIDYVLASNGIKECFDFSDIQAGLMGSDHCPVFATLRDKLDNLYLSDVMNPDGMFEDGVRKREWSQKDLLPLSGKLIPEFDKRRSIKDMFFKAKSRTTVKREGGGSSSSSSVGPWGSLAPTAKGTKKEEEDEDSLFVSQRTASPSPAKKPTPKRLAEASLASRPLKKARPAPPPKAKVKAGKGQSTLASFFKPKAAAPPSTPKADESGGSGGGSATPDHVAKTSDPSPSTPIPASPSITSTQTQDLDIPPSSTSASTSKPDAFTLTPSNDKKFIDPIVSKNSWSKLMAKPRPPNCEHSEPCIIFQTKKPGANKGRSFFVCSRPLGPSGDKESGTEWKCGTFIWCSDWNAGAAAVGVMGTGSSEATGGGGGNDDREGNWRGLGM